MRHICLALAFILTAPLAQAQTVTLAEISRGAIERRAVEAVIWGMPAVNTDLMRHAARKYGFHVVSIKNKWRQP